MEDGWNPHFGELRSSLEAKDLAQAGALAWTLRRLNNERYQTEIATYIQDHSSQQGEHMALETQQRLEAFRHSMNELLTGEHSERWTKCCEKLIAGSSKSSAQPRVRREQSIHMRLLPYPLDIPWVGKPYVEDNRLKHAEYLRQDAADILWSILQDHDST